ncbi:MAG: histidine kinase, partial [Burkholderiales bacterium]
MHEPAKGTGMPHRLAAARSWVTRQWAAFDHAWRDIGRAEVLWTLAVALTFTVGHAYALNIAPGRYWPLPIRAYEWFYVPLSLVYVVAFRFAEYEPEPRSRLWWRYVIAIAAAILVFSLTIDVIGSSTNEKHNIAGAAALFWGVLQSLLFGSISAVVYSSLARSRRARVAFEAAALQRAGSHRRVSAARLASQQARLEPTFLFGSLDLVQSLYERDPAAAEATLQNLIDYLRAALPQLGEEGSTLGREVDLARLYLGIMRARMGSRLVVEIGIEPDAEAASFPPMIVVPLVEHAVRHGLEPLPHGGRLAIRAARRAERLEVVVAQDGLAFDLAAAWLAPLHERLLGHYGDAARLTVTTTSRGGTATIDVPYESSSSGIAPAAAVA